MKTLNQLNLAVLVITAAVALAACSSGTSGGQSVAIPNAADMAGAWEFQAPSTANPGNVAVIETNLYVTNAGALDSGTFVILDTQQQGSQLEIEGVGGECDPSTVFAPSSQSYITLAEHSGAIEFTLEESGVNGTLNATGTVTFSGNSANGTYSIPAGCGYAADSGTVTGVKINPFSGTYSGTLNGDAVTVTLSVQDNGSGGLSVTGTGTDNGTPLTLSGPQAGGVFVVNVEESGTSTTFGGIYDPTGNDFVVYDASLDFLGYLYAGTNPNAQVAKRLFIPKR
jgi:hypothetical protein